MKIYENNPMNQPRLKTDALFTDVICEAKYNGIIGDTFKFVRKEQSLSAKHWKKFVDLYKMPDADADGGWRGEYWGKMMRGASFVYSYTRDPELYGVLADTVRDMISAERVSEGGRISTYAASHEFCHWDIWSRKYVLLGMQYFYEVCTDESLRAEIILSMRKQVDYIMSKIGGEDGKKRITLATYNWRGLNSSSILEPIVRLYSLTGEKKYLDFATYIVEEGGIDGDDNIFKLAYEDKLSPYQYPITKAYEMTSCFEGLLEYYRIVGTEWHKEAIIKFANRVLEDDFTVIGGAGCTHELFDHSTVRQANTTNNPIMQETCVTVTLMKFFYQLHVLTGDPRYADAFETSLYNAYLGALNTEGQLNLKLLSERPELIPEAMPFDSYSPLTAGTRGLLIGGMKPMADNTYYGCCACIGAAGIGLVPKMHALVSKTGVIVNLYIDGNVTLTLQNDRKITLKTKTEYPKSDKIKIKIGLDKNERFALFLRNPAWSKTTGVLLNGTELPVTDGYTVIDREFSDGDEIELLLDMRTVLIRPTPYGTQSIMTNVIWDENRVESEVDVEDPMAKRHLALRRGPLMLAQDERLGYSVADPISVLTDEENYASATVADSAPYPNIVTMSVELKDGERITLTDYASAGKLWNNGKKIAVWMLVE